MPSDGDTTSIWSLTWLLFKPSYRVMYFCLIYHKMHQNKTVLSSVTFIKGFKIHMEWTWITTLTDQKNLSQCVLRLFLLGGHPYDTSIHFYTYGSHTQEYIQVWQGIYTCVCEEECIQICFFHIFIYIPPVSSWTSKSFSLEECDIWVLEMLNNVSAMFSFE